MTDRFLVNYIHIYVCSCLFANWQEECSSKYKSVSPILVNNVKFGNSSVVTQLVCGSLEVTQRKIQSEIHRQMAKWQNLFGRKSNSTITNVCSFVCSSVRLFVCQQNPSTA